MQFRRSSFFFLALFLLAVEANASSFPIIKIHRPQQVIAELPPDEEVKEDTVVVITDEKEEVIAIGKIRDIENDSDPRTVKVDIIELVDNKLIMTGDKVWVFNDEFVKTHEVPGFFSLTFSDKNDLPAKYKQLAYFGVFTADGHTINEDEFLVSPAQFQYGISDSLNLKVVNALWFDGYVNAGAKVRLLDKKWGVVTVNGLGAYKVHRQDWIAQLGGVLTIPSNSKFQSHYVASFVFDPQFEESRATEGLGLYETSDIRNITEYITDDWDRILFGPIYNFELQTFGGTISYVWIWNTVHIALGVATRDFTSLNFDAETGYYLQYDLFWRF